MKFTKMTFTLAFAGYLGITALSSTTFAADLKNGKKVYEQNCASCHGVTGKGDTAIAGSLNPKPRNFAKGVFLYGSKDSDLEKIIKNGKGVMPKWGGVIPDKNIKDVVSYIRTLKK